MDKILYWRVGFLAPPSIPESGNKFEELYAATNAKLHSVMLFFAPLAFLLCFMNLITRWNVEPRWFERIPCLLQDDMNSFLDHYKAGIRALLVLDLFPTACGGVCAFIYLRGFTTQKRPLLGWLALGWFWKVLVPLAMFTFINFKLP